jgi:hypothetical protein
LRQKQVERLHITLLAICSAPAKGCDMKHPWLPSPDDIMRMPAGDRVPRLLSLVRHHRDALATIQPKANDRASRYSRTRHTRDLANVESLVQSLGLEACLK